MYIMWESEKLQTNEPLSEKPNRRWDIHSLEGSTSKETIELKNNKNNYSYHILAVCYS